MKPLRTDMIIIGCVFIVTAAYLAYLALSWQAYQKDRSNRDSKIDELLTRLPKPKPADAD